MDDIHTRIRFYKDNAKPWGDTHALDLAARDALKAEAKVAELETVAKRLHSACDVLMGDSDADDDDSELVQAMRGVAKCIPGPW